MAYPAIPYTLSDLTRTLLSHDRVSKTIDGLQNMYAGSVDASDGSHHVAFISPRMLEYLGTLKLLQGDGTFKARPNTPASSQCFVLVSTWRDCVSAVRIFSFQLKSS